MIPRYRQIDDDLMPEQVRIDPLLDAIFNCAVLDDLPDAAVLSRAESV
jgi:hypothetical protein